MVTIVTRAGKGSALSYTEMDANLNNLNTGKLETNSALGTPASGTLTNCSGLPAAGVSGTALVTADVGTTVQAYDPQLDTWSGVTPGTGVATALAVNIGTAGSPVINGGDLGTPSSGNLSNCTGYPSPSGLLTAGTPLVLNPYVTNTTTTQAHGLGSVPAILVITLECLSADNGWSVGDVILYPHMETGLSNAGTIWQMDATNVISYTGTDPIPGRNKSTRSNVNLTSTKWKVTATPYKLS